MGLIITSYNELETNFNTEKEFLEYSLPLCLIDQREEHAMHYSDWKLLSDINFYFDLLTCQSITVNL